MAGFLTSVWLLLAGAIPSLAVSAPSIRWLPDETPPAVEVVGADPTAWAQLGPLPGPDPRWTEVLVVYAEAPGAGTEPRVKVPPMAGSWRVTQDRLRFEPRFPLAQGVRYRAEFRARDAQPVVSFFELPPDRQAPTTIVTTIFPTADELPENQLKFYVQFSAAMSRGRVYEHVHIRDAAGRVIDLPFLELDEELWDPGMTRLTLLIDPGRIKRGVKPLEDIGPVFEQGKRYALTVEAACRDAAGRPLRADFAKEFAIGPADRSPPDPQRWKALPPRAGTRAPLVVEFDEPLDQALALRLIVVARGTKGQTELRGEATLGERERSWRFVPDEPWVGGPHRVVVATTIEDLAGNNIGKTFDVDLASGAPRSLASDVVTVAFEVK